MYNEGGGAALGGGGALSAGGLAVTGFSVMGFAIVAFALILAGVLVFRLATVRPKQPGSHASAIVRSDPQAALVAALAANSSQDL